MDDEIRRKIMALLDQHRIMTVATLRPDGTVVQVMPFESLKAMSEVDLRALHLYLREVKVQP